MVNTNQVTTRFAPSPTGLLHVGNYRTAVFAYLYAKKHNGKFIVRIENTDKERSKQEYEDNIIDALNWLELKYDEKYRQSENIESHKKYLQELLEGGHAYISKEVAKDGSGLIRELVRFKNKKEVVVFDDAIRGKIETDTADLGDFVIAKSLDEPLFHLAVVVDDYEEGVTHILRGEDHIPNTPRQILIARALNFPIPTYAHLPLVLAEDRTKFSKRKGALPITDYRDAGYLKEALVNFMALTGWNPGGEQEIFALHELVSLFEIEKIHKGGAIFDTTKLLWMNKEHMKRQGKDVQLEMVKPYMKGYGEELLIRLLPTIIDRISNYGELSKIEESEFRFFISQPKVDIAKIAWKDDSLSTVKTHLEKVKEILQRADFLSPEKIKEAIMSYAEKNGKGNVLWPLRYALSGQEKSVDPFTICHILGREAVIQRIDMACKIIDS
jgi:glutamyl-tRNA synthetase